MEHLSSDPIEIGLTFEGEVNGASIELHGASRGVFASGTPTASLRAPRRLPDGFDIGLLTYVALTGHPSMSRVMPGAVNPFLVVGGVYDATRTLELGPYGRLRTDYSVFPEGDGLKETFQVTGEAKVPPVVSVAPTVETWVPMGPGHISGHFTMVWSTEDGSQIKGEAFTDYRLELEDVLPGVQFRDIRIELSSTPDRLEQKEQITIFTPEVLADALSPTPAAVLAGDAAG